MSFTSLLLTLLAHCCPFVLADYLEATGRCQRRGWLAGHLGGGHGGVSDQS